MFCSRATGERVRDLEVWDRARLRGPHSRGPTTAASLRKSPSARAGGGAQAPPPRARPRDSGRGDWSGGGARLQTGAAPGAHGGSSPPPPFSPRSLDGTFYSARLVDAASASLSPRRPEEEEETHLGRRR